MSQLYNNIYTILQRKVYEKVTEISKKNEKEVSLKINVL
jgi:hypothetical protein